MPSKFDTRPLGVFLTPGRAVLDPTQLTFRGVFADQNPIVSDAFQTSDSTRITTTTTTKHIASHRQTYYTMGLNEFKDRRQSVRRGELLPLRGQCRLDCTRLYMLHMLLHGQYLTSLCVSTVWVGHFEGRKLALNASSTQWAHGTWLTRISATLNMLCKHRVYYTVRMRRFANDRRQQQNWHNRCVCLIDGWMARR